RLLPSQPEGGGLHRRRRLGGLEIRRDLVPRGVQHLRLFGRQGGARADPAYRPDLEPPLPRRRVSAARRPDPATGRNPGPRPLHPRRAPPLSASALSGRAGLERDALRRVLLAAPVGNGVTPWLLRGSANSAVIFFEKIFPTNSILPLDVHGICAMIWPTGQVHISCN